MTIGIEQKKMHHDLRNVGLRAQATAAGLVQLCKELQSAGVIDEMAIERIKGAVADEIVLTGPRPILRADYRSEVCERLNAIFSGQEKVGSAEALSFATEKGD